MTRHVARCLFAILLWLITCEAHAADISVKSMSPMNLIPNLPVEMVTIRVTGPFRRGDVEMMRRVLGSVMAKSAALPDIPLATVELSSLGGDLYEGLQMGYLFRDFDVATVVRRGDICLSACALAFLGGTANHGWSGRLISHMLEIGGNLGFHSFWLNTDSAQQPTATDRVEARVQGFREALHGAGAVTRYAAKLNIDPDFIAAMLAKPPEEFLYVNTTEEFLTLGVCPIGLRRPSISSAQQALNICNNSIAWIDPVELSQVREMTPRQAKRYMLENVQQNMLLLAVKGALAKQLASYSAMRDERAIDNLYDDLRAAGVRLPQIVGPVFEVSGYRVGNSEAQCFVSLSLEDPDRYDVAIRRPRVWAHPDRSAPKDCRGLFLNDKDALINPRP